MTLTRLALAGLLVAGSLVLAAFLLASVAEDVTHVSLREPTGEPMASPALDGPPALSMVTCVLPAGFVGPSGVTAPTVWSAPPPIEQDCSERWVAPRTFRRPLVTEC